MTSSSSKTLKAQCHCGSASFTTPLSDAQTPLPATLCHCTSCRHAFGTLANTNAFWPPMTLPENIDSTCTKYPFSERIEFYFCRTCGAHMFSHGHDGKGGTSFVGVKTGVLRHAGEYLDWIQQIFVKDTGDGGLAEWLKEVNGKEVVSADNSDRIREVFMERFAKPTTEVSGQESKEVTSKESKEVASEESKEVLSDTTPTVLQFTDVVVTKKTVVPVVETHHVVPEIHTATALPTMSLADFEDKGGVLTGRGEREGTFEGEPTTIGGTESTSAEAYVTGEVVEGTTTSLPPAEIQVSSTEASNATETRTTVEAIEVIPTIETTIHTTKHTIIPIHETHHNAPEVLEASALPTMTLADFEDKGGVLTGREERRGSFLGEPTTIGGPATESAEPYITGPPASISTTEMSGGCLDTKLVESATSEIITTATMSQKADPSAVNTDINTSTPVSNMPTNEAFTSNDVLPAHCHCQGTHFIITRPSECSLAPTTTAGLPDVLEKTPSTAYNKDSWWLPTPTKYLAGTCACNSCRHSSGASIVQWAFVPAANVYVPADAYTEATGLDIDTNAKDELEISGTKHVPYRLRTGFGTLKSHDSSQGVTRWFCRVCGASVFWTSRSRESLLDIGVGVLSSQAGARAEDWLKWVKERVSFEEEAGDVGLIKAIGEGLRGYEPKESGMEAVEA